MTDRYRNHRRAQRRGPRKWRARVTKRRVVIRDEKGSVVEVSATGIRKLLAGGPAFVLAGGRVELAELTSVKRV